MISAGHFHGMPLALAMSYVKAAIPVLASISERRLNKLVDPATNDGLPAVPDRQRGRHRIGLHDRAVHRRGDRQRPGQPRACRRRVYSIPTSANAEDHVSMGANEARHVLAMADDLGKVLALELYTAAQALDLRPDMINAARKLASGTDAEAFAAKIAWRIGARCIGSGCVPRRSRRVAARTRRGRAGACRVRPWPPRTLRFVDRFRSWTATARSTGKSPRWCAWWMKAPSSRPRDTRCGTEPR